MDNQVTVWDVRKYDKVHSYFSNNPATWVDISQKNLLAVGSGPHVHVWKDAFLSKQHKPYMRHLLPGKMLVDGMFCPYEDVLGLGK